MIDLRLTLGIDAQRFTQQVQDYNTEIEEQIQKGVEKALDELCKEGTLIELVKEQVKKQAISGVTTYMFKYDLQKAMHDKIQDNFSKKIGQIADKLSVAMAKELGVDISEFLDK